MSGKLDGVESDGDAKSPISDVSSIMDVPEKATAAITTANAPITPPTKILGFNIIFVIRLFS